MPQIYHSTHSKINNGPPAIGNHCPGMGQLKKTIIRFYRPDLNQPEVIRYSDPYTGEYAGTVVDTKDLIMTLAQLNVWRDLTS